MAIALPLIAIIAGLLAASSVVITKMPDAENLIQKIKPYEGFIGAASLIMGVLTIFSISTMLRVSVLYGIISLTCILSAIVMGFLLGYPVLQEFLLDDLSEETRKKSEELYERLTPYKVTSGLAAMFSGVYLLFF